MRYQNPANGLTLEQMQEQLDQLAHDAAYHPGDSVPINNYCAPGHVTTNATDLFLDFFLPRPIGDDVESATVSGGTIQARGNKQYILGSSSGGAEIDTLNVREITPAGSHVRIIIRNSTAFNATNNTPAVGYTTGMTITFH